MISLMAKEPKSLLMRMKEDNEKGGLKLKIIKQTNKQTKLRSWHPAPSLHGRKKKKKWKQ